MIRSIAFLVLFSVTACGVQGDLYLPDQQPPKRDRNATPTPFPEQPREEQGIMPEAL